jgi:antitoxin (DNA-binding transcriptional repressor) of toxin-antitoxin stability system
MSQAALKETKDNLSAFIDAILTGKEPYHVITKRSRPVARIVPIQQDRDVSKRLGLCKDDPRFAIDDEAFDAMDGEIAELFGA